jgi:predicted lactoylglutathione lyase
MPRELYMIGLIVKDMGRALEFYRRIGMEIPEDSAQKSHVEIKMSGGLTFFLDSRPDRWDPQFQAADAPPRAGGYGSLLEFYLGGQQEVDTLYQELTAAGYNGYRAPYATAFGMYFAMVNDPDGNVILLSGDLA